MSNEAIKKKTTEKESPIAPKEGQDAASLAKSGAVIPTLNELSPEEAQQLASMRAASESRRKCALEIDAILTAYNSILVIDPQSPHGAPQIIVSFR
jgi:hypothetical protein